MPPSLSPSSLPGKVSNFFTTIWGINSLNTGMQAKRTYFKNQYNIMSTQSSCVQTMLCQITPNFTVYMNDNNRTGFVMFSMLSDFFKTWQHNNNNNTSFIFFNFNTSMYHFKVIHWVIFLCIHSGPLTMKYCPLTMKHRQQRFYVYTYVHLSLS